MCLLPCRLCYPTHSLWSRPVSFTRLSSSRRSPADMSHPRRRRHPALITGFLHFGCRCFATSGLRTGFICRRWWKVQQSSFDFPARWCQLKEVCILTPPEACVGVILPTVHSAVLLLYSDRFSCGTYTIYLLQQEGNAIYHNMITHYSVYCDKWDGWL